MTRRRIDRDRVETRTPTALARVSTPPLVDAETLNRVASPIFSRASLESRVAPCSRADER
jgi:hypothetical protein